MNNQKNTLYKHTQYTQHITLYNPFTNNATVTIAIIKYSINANAPIVSPIVNIIFLNLPTKNIATIAHNAVIIDESSNIINVLLLYENGVSLNTSYKRDTNINCKNNNSINCVPVSNTLNMERSPGLLIEQPRNAYNRFKTPTNCPIINIIAMNTLCLLIEKRCLLFFLWFLYARMNLIVIVIVIKKIIILHANDPILTRLLELQRTTSSS